MGADAETKVILEPQKACDGSYEGKTIAKAKEEMPYKPKPYGQMQHLDQHVQCISHDTTLYYKSATETVAIHGDRLYLLLRIERLS